MKTTIKTRIKSGAIASNHNLKVRSSVKGGRIATNHNLSALLPIS